MIKRPSPLRPGDRIAVVGGSSYTEMTREQLESGVRKMGLEPVIFESALSKHGPFAGPDDLRARDINAAFADDSIKGIVPMRGGYGSHRSLPYIDFELISKHPKFFGGYSDVTAYINNITQRCGFETYHMPMVESWEKGMDAYTESYVRAMLFGEKTGYKNPPGYDMNTINGGVAEGEICGGNLSLICYSLGTKFEIDTRGKILFVETVNGRPTQLDAFFTQLRNAGKLDDAAGIMLGQFTDTVGEPEEIKERFELVLNEILIPTKKPMIKGLMIGHGKIKMSLPIGRRMRLDADRCTLTEV
ncbi:MAG: LD-carboxypeptidase [Clostridia bacterium]|nr:LD-carboxypeptidase [Clostridia bacterium]